MIYRNSRGFTLLELMIVVGILGILIAAVTVNMGPSRDHFKLHTTARKCVSDTRYAQQLSLDTKSRHGIYLSTGGYDIRKVDTGDVVKSVDFSNGIEYERIEGTSDNELIFGTDGTPLGSDGINPIASAARINIRVPGTSDRIYVIVTPGTGEVSLSWN